VLSPDRPSLWLRSVAWALAALAAAAVALLTLPVAPKVWFAILPHLGPNVSAWFVGAGVLLAAALVASAWGAGPHRRTQALAAVALLLAAYLALLFVYYRGEPAVKKVHLLEYGLLSAVALNAVRVNGWRGPLAAALFLLAVGTCDEAAQARIPMRTFRWLDLVANYIGAALGALAWLAASRESPWRRAPATRGAP